MALPNPPHPTNTQRFIVYMTLPSTKLVECNKSVKTCSVVIYSSYNEKTSKKPSRGRVRHSQKIPKNYDPSESVTIRQNPSESVRRILTDSDGVDPGGDLYGQGS